MYLPLDMPANILFQNSTFQQILILLSLYINSFLHGCIYGWMSIAVYFFNEGEQISATLTEYAWIAAMAEIGKIIAALPAGIATDKYGKKKVLFIIGFINLIAWMMLSLSTSIVFLCLARFMLGISMSLTLTTGTAYIGEIASPKNRGKFSGAYQASSSAGILFPGLLGAISSSYRLPAYGTTSVVLFYFIFLYWTTETPNYYIARQQYEKAIEVLHKIRISSHKEDIISEYEGLKTYIENEKTQQRQLSWLQFVRSKPIRKSIMTGTLIEFFTTLTGLFAISAFMANIIPKNRYISDKYYPSISLSLSTICNICSTFVIERLPRRISYIMGGLAGFLIQAVNGYLRYLCDKHNEEYYFWLFIAGYASLRVLWGTLVLPLQQTIKSEIFPQAVKGFANSICIICASIATLISYKLFHLSYQYFGLHYLFVSFSMAFLCLTATVYFRLPESRGKRIADLQVK